MVASYSEQWVFINSCFVSIPFIAGQWSLPVAVVVLIIINLPGFQSPSLRGSGRFSWLSWLLEMRPTLFQSPSLRGSGRFVGVEFRVNSSSVQFQSPSLRGSGRFSRSSFFRDITRSESFNPLHCGAVVASCILGLIGVSLTPSFNPLHCGAVVASRALGELLGLMDSCFNPLHCGAVVASLFRFLLIYLPPYVSIPFIAGQWSLPISPDPLASVVFLFQSPSLRGSGRFAASRWFTTRKEPCFNPLHCGAVVASGCWGLGWPVGLSRFQSPSLRGSGRF